MEYDSIYSFYPKVKMVVSDYEGVCNEYLAFVDGTEVEILFGSTDEEIKKCKFTVAKNAVPQQKTPNGIGGDYEIELTHNYYSKQFKRSKAYQSNISDIIKSLLKDYPFESLDIESTLNNGLWYQPYVNDSEFIVDYLSPFAYSSTSQNTPFYTFIDTNNVFHFKSFNSMFSAKPTVEMTYTTDGVAIIADENSFSSVNFSQSELSKIKPFFNLKMFTYDKDGKLDYEDNLVSKYFRSEGYFPIIADEDKTTSILSVYDNDINLEDTNNNNKGYMINQHKEMILPDKIVINTVLNKSLVSGQVLQINLPTVKSNDTDEKSLRTSGKYLIESSYHIWDSKTSRTMLVCSKQNVKLTDDYRNKNYFLSN